MRIVGVSVDHGHYEAWSVVSVRADGAEVGRRVALSEWTAAGNAVQDFPGAHWFVLDLPDYPLDKNLMHGEYEFGLTDRGDPVRDVINKAAWKIDHTLLDAATLAALQSPGGEATVDVNTGRPWVRRKDDNAELPVRLADPTQTPEEDDQAVTAPRDRVGNKAEIRFPLGPEKKRR